MKIFFYVNLLLAMLFIVPINIKANQGVFQKSTEVTNKNLFVAEKVTVVNGTSKDVLHKYCIAIGKYSSMDDASKAKNVFSNLGEKPIIVKAAEGDIYYVILDGADYPDIAALRLKGVIDKYVGESDVDAQIKKYGIPLHPCILVTK